MASVDGPLGNGMVQRRMFMSLLLPGRACATPFCLFVKSISLPMEIAFTPTEVY